MHMAVIDVNVPEQITITDDRKVDQTRSHVGSQVQYDARETDVARQEAIKLAEYIWENYIEPFDFDGGIWLVGAGNAFHAIARLLSDKEGLYQRISGVIGFLCQNPVRPVSSHNNQWLRDWYREHSRVFVADDNPVWNNAKDGKTASRKYGKLIRCRETILNQMLQNHIDEVFEYIRATGDFEMMDEDDSSTGVDQDSDATEDENEVLESDIMTTHGQSLQAAFQHQQTPFRNNPVTAPPPTVAATHALQQVTSPDLSSQPYQPQSVQQSPPRQGTPVRNPAQSPLAAHVQLSRDITSPGPYPGSYPASGGNAGE